jgi:hypothetical protein
LLYAKMNIRHGEREPVAVLQAAIDQPHSEEAIRRSGALLQVLATKGVVEYVAETPEYFIGCRRRESGEMEVVLECKHGSIRDHCERVWEAFQREAGGDRAPQISALALIDATAGEPLLAGRCGARSIIEQRTDFQLALLGAVLSLIVLAIILGFGLLDEQTQNLWIQAAPAFIVGLASVLLVAKEARHRGLIWSSTGRR